MEETAPLNDMDGTMGDEIMDEPGMPDGDMFMSADTDGDGMLSAEEFAAGWADVDMTMVDTDGDGMVSRAEYDAYMVANPGM